MAKQMTSKERMMRALHREKPDRLPVSIHQWQQYHLDTYMGGVDALTAFRMTGMDAAIQYFEAMGQFWIPDAEQYVAQTPQWRDEIKVVNPDPSNKVLHHTITTPEGKLTYKTGGNLTTTWITEYLIKRHDDIELIAKYMPVSRLDKKKVATAYDAVGDAGILRGFVWGDQAGCWQHACCLMDVQDLIMESFDNPDWLHRLLGILLEKKLRFIEESLKGAKFDLIETGGGAGSDTVISPAMHHEFCMPYDRQMHRALHDAGHISTYHTCGGMMHILDLIVQNETDASETLTPPGTGGNITQPEKVRQVYADKVAMIGGMDQFNIITSGTKEQIRAEVRRLFEGFGKDGGYILSMSDHFFDTPVENLKVYAEAAKECRY
jgi:uroporphyrinogen decarboxylase